MQHIILKRSDHVLPIEIIFVISSTSSACYKSIITRVKVGREDGLGFWCVVCESEGPHARLSQGVAEPCAPNIKHVHRHVHQHDDYYHYHDQSTSLLLS